MLHKTRGIVLRTTKYSESSLIAHIFTEKFGLQSYLIKGARKPKAKIRANQLLPLSLVDMVVYHKQTGGLQSIAELKVNPIFNTIPFEIIKNSIALFICDVIYHAVRIQQSDEQLFQYIHNAIEFLDIKEDYVVNFHLVFMLGLSRFLGFYPSLNYENDSNYFDLKNGVFLKQDPGHTMITRDTETSALKLLMKCSFDSLEQLNFSSSVRKKTLTNLISYFKCHLDNFGEMKSYLILEEVLS